MKLSPLNPLFAIAILIIAAITGLAIKKIFKIKNESNQYKYIDGLRGFLALSVFIHHSISGYVDFHPGEASLSNFHIQLGQTSVFLFFMITSFLFTTKLLQSINKQFNWKFFFISRIFRLVPMYLVTIFLSVLCIMTLSNWNLKVPLTVFLRSLLNWLFFTINNAPTINEISFGPIGIVWTLTYEWLFYFSLPLMALLIIKKKPSWVYILLSLLFLVFFYRSHSFLIYPILSFAGGIFAALMLKFFPYRQKITSYFFSAIIFLAFVGISQFNSAWNIYCIIFITIIFTLIALGNSFFSLLGNTTLKLLGDISYSTYLLHGILLFFVFSCLLDDSQIKLFSPTKYCVIIFLITPMLVTVSFFGYRYIEKPFMNRSKRIIKSIT